MFRCLNQLFFMESYFFDLRQAPGFKEVNLQSTSFAITPTDWFGVSPTNDLDFDRFCLDSEFLVKYDYQLGSGKNNNL